MGDIVRVKPRGDVRLPATLRERYAIEPGDAYHIVDLDGTFVLSPVAPKVPELAQEISKLRAEAGLSVADPADRGPMCLPSDRQAQCQATHQDLPTPLRPIAPDQR